MNQMRPEAPMQSGMLDQSVDTNLEDTTLDATLDATLDVTLDVTLDQSMNPNRFGHLRFCPLIETCGVRVMWYAFS